MKISHNFLKFVEKLTVDNIVNNLKYDEVCDTIRFSMYLPEPCRLSVLVRFRRGDFIPLWRCSDVIVYSGLTIVMLDDEYEKVLKKHFNKLWRNGLKQRIKNINGLENNRKYIEMEELFKDA